MNYGTLRNEALAAIQAAPDSSTQSRRYAIKYLGRKGALTLILRSLGNIPPEQRAPMGKLSNEYKNEIEAALDDRKKRPCKDRRRRALSAASGST